MARRFIGIALVALALAVPQGIEGQSFSWCNSITSGACFNFGGSSWGGSTSWSTSSWGSTSYGSLHSWIRTLVERVVVRYDLSDWFDNHHGNPNNPGPSTSVPEPSVWMLLATGVAAMATAGWYRRRPAV